MKGGHFRERTVPSVILSFFLGVKKGSGKRQTSIEKSSVGFEGASGWDLSSSAMTPQSSKPAALSFPLTAPLTITRTPLSKVSH